MNERTLLGIDCNGTELYGKLDKISVHTNNHQHCDGSSWGWRWLGVQNTFAGQTKMEADSQKISLRFDEQME